MRANRNVRPTSGDSQVAPTGLAEDASQSQADILVGDALS